MQSLNKSIGDIRPATVGCFLSFHGLSHMPNSLKEYGSTFIGLQRRCSLAPSCLTPLNAGL